MPRPTYTAEPVDASGAVADVRVQIDGKTWHLWGRQGVEREAQLAAETPAGTLPVLVGAGLGHGLSLLAERGIPVAVVDAESAISDLTGSRRLAKRYENILWIDDTDPAATMRRLTEWQAENGHLPFAPVAIPLYLRLDRALYATVAQALKAAAETDFWSRARYPKFRSAKPRILFFDSNYFLCREILSALKRLGIEHRALALESTETGSGEFVESLLKATLEFKPDFVLTVNHFGLDREGRLAGLLNDLGLPLASWFVDNPHLILYDYAHPGTDNTVIFTYDAGNLDQMRARGFNEVHYLPLATDPHHFKPPTGIPGPAQWTADVSFVGSSMTEPVARSLNLTGLPPEQRKAIPALAAAFDGSGETSVRRFLENSRPEWIETLQALPTRENRLALESVITWEATRQYRLRCVQGILDFSPLIVGDDGWKDQLGPTDGWHHLDRLDYYADLPRFYPMSAVNFNCTSRQMIGAVNQRVFDVPACGGFIITDYREQMEDLFDLQREAVVYERTEDIPHMVRELLDDAPRRKAVSAAATRRILAEHTYQHRLATLVAVMRRTFG